MIYLDYAATSPVRREVLEEMLPYFASSSAIPILCMPREDERRLPCVRRATASLRCWA